MLLSVENLFENSFKQADLDKRKAEIDKLLKQKTLFWFYNLCFTK